MNVLFVCNQNENRSKTAEALFRDRFETRSAGLFNNTPLGESELVWADTVVVMEEHQRGEIAKRFPSLYMKKRILNLNIADEYIYGQEKLKEELNLKMNELQPF